jgi:hypothetical protein
MARSWRFPGEEESRKQRSQAGKVRDDVVLPVKVGGLARSAELSVV